ncbi:SGNH/GDSL hydrolase family protein [Actinoplanes sp. RD1]|uniref:SGNH/GDSL hydrolase family protein n=1 Tax=Actinoplanes sp. RD1 TaxID=3064538 RepID=UPI0027425A9A|nr:SGNH/GDSL hydrolase family protein [Actinoplanes sp. RD1]
MGRWAGTAVLGVSVVATAVALAGIGPASAAEPVRIMPLGASITYGYGSSDGNGYRGRLYERLTRDAGMNVDFVGSQRSGRLRDRDHEGHPGWRIDQIAAHAGEWLAAYRPDVVIMHLGTNDMIQDYRSATAPERLAALCREIVRRDPGVTVYVSSLVASTDTAVDGRIDAFNARLPGVLAGLPQVVYVDQHAAMDRRELSDEVHPTDQGYREIADAWYAAMRR